MLKSSLTREAVFAEVRAQLERIAAGKPHDPAPITEETTFADVGVTSLGLAELISNLESTFDVDPFAERVPITSIRTLGDLCDAYLSCLTPPSPGDDALDAELRAVRVRALDGKPR